MIEWILVLTIHMGDLESYEANLVDGFSSQEKCMAAGSVIGDKITKQFINHKATKMGVNNDSVRPAIFVDCTSIEK